ncbi:MAG: DUF5348 domain-containing protein [Lachnospiraceae bacterium]|nr:DUF5348 domain-containing protein [Lachnospiraceae bacterium]
MIMYEEWLKSVEALQRQIDDFFYLTGYLDFEQVQIPDLVPTAETLYVQEQLEKYCHELEEAFYQAKRLSAKVMVTGKIRRGENGRFWLENEELAVGRSIELLYDDGRNVEPIESWHAGHIAHNGARYYFTGNRNIELEGAYARIKHHL